VPLNTTKLREHQSFQQIIGTILPTFSIKSLSHGKKKELATGRCGETVLYKQLPHTWRNNPI
jgi:hypothetical protein